MKAVPPEGSLSGTVSDPLFSKNTGNRPHTDPSSKPPLAYLNFALFWQDITQLTIPEKIRGICRCRLHCSLECCSNFLIHRKLMIIRWDSGNLSKSRLLTKFHQFSCNRLKETKCYRFLYVVKIRFHKVRPFWGAQNIFFDSSENHCARKLQMMPLRSELSAFDVADDYNLPLITLCRSHSVPLVMLWAWLRSTLIFFTIDKRTMFISVIS